MDRGRGVCAAALLAALAWGCGGAPFWPRAIAECPGPVRATGEIAGDLRIEARLRVSSPSVDTALRLVVEKRGEKLTLVGLSPLGAVLFSVVQSGKDLEVEALPPSLLEIPPENVLRDVHRVYFFALGGEGAPPLERGGLRVTELWRDGALLRRSFDAPGSTSAVDFVPEPAEGLAEARVHHPGCGYEATLVTLVREGEGKPG